MADTPTYTIDLLPVGVLEVPTVEIYWMHGFGEWEDLTFIVGVCRGGGRTVLLNTGFQDPPDEIRNYWVNWNPRIALRQSEEQKTRNALAKIGVAPEQVDTVIITPLTAYAAGSISLFPRAQICLSRRGWLDFMAPDPIVPQLPRNITIPASELKYLLDNWDRVRLLPDEETEVVPGIRTFFAGTHHRSSMAVLINTRDGVACFADCMFKFGNIERNHPLGIAESLEENYHTYHRIRQSATIMIPPYDGECFTRYPGGRIGY